MSVIGFVLVGLSLYLFTANGTRNGILLILSYMFVLFFLFIKYDKKKEHAFDKCLDKFINLPQYKDKIDDKMLTILKKTNRLE